MHWQDAILLVAGVLGSSVAVIHGILVQRYMVGPIGDLSAIGNGMAASTLRLVRLLLHFSTFAWFIGGIALVIAAIWLQRDARLVTCILIGILYLFGAIGNFWGTRGRHPGWMLMASALVLIVLGANGAGV